MEELIPIVAKLAEQYTGYESTSVTYEKADQLMRAVTYCIHEYEASGRDGGVSSGKISAKEAYRLGYRLVEEKVMNMKETYHGLLCHFRSYGNIALADTVAAIPEFLKWYDIKYDPQDTILTLDYPLLKDLRELTGIDAVHEYVKCIAIEQRFLNQFPEAYVVKALRAYGEDCGAEYEEMFENLCGILLKEIMCRILLKKPFDEADSDKTGLTEEDYGRVGALLGMHTEEGAKRLGQESVKNFLEKFYKESGEIWDYVEAECADIVSRLLHHCNSFWRFS